VTINDLGTNASILHKSIEANSSKQEKDEEASSSKKTMGKKEKFPIEDLNVEAPKSLRFALQTKSDALQKVMIASMTRRRTSSMKGARGVRL